MVVVLVVDVAVVHIVGRQLLCEFAVAGLWCERNWIKIAVQLDFDCCAKYSVVAVARLLREIAVIAWRDCCEGLLSVLRLLSIELRLLCNWISIVVQNILWLQLRDCSARSL